MLPEYTLASIALAGPPRKNVCTAKAFACFTLGDLIKNLYSYALAQFDFLNVPGVHFQ